MANSIASSATIDRVHALDSSATKRCTEIHERVPATVSASVDVGTGACEAYRCSDNFAVVSSPHSCHNAFVLVPRSDCFLMFYITVTASNISDLMLDVMDTV